MTSKWKANIGSYSDLILMHCVALEIIFNFQKSSRVCYSSAIPNYSEYEITLIKKKHSLHKQGSKLSGMSYKVIFVR